jgi:hypothetical protein
MIHMHVIDGEAIVCILKNSFWQQSSPAVHALRASGALLDAATEYRMLNINSTNFPLLNTSKLQPLLFMGLGGEGRVA